MKTSQIVGPISSGFGIWMYMQCGGLLDKKSEVPAWGWGQGKCKFRDIGKEICEFATRQGKHLKYQIMHSPHSPTPINMNFKANKLG